MGRGSLRGARYVRVAPGWYRLQSPETTTQRVLDAARVMPAGAVLAGWAAAYVHGLDVFDGLDDHTLEPLPVDVLLPPGHHRADAPGLRYRQCRRPPRSDRVDGLPVTSLMRTAMDLACHAPDLTEAVVALDAFLAARRLTHEAMDRGLQRLDGARGVEQAGGAVALARVGVRSGWESRLRVFAHRYAGLTELEPNRALFDLTGALLGIPDLLDTSAGLVLEYDGARWRGERSHGHRDRDQHREDNAREERLERAGLIVVRAERADLTRHRVELASRIRSGFADGLTRDRSRDRWTTQEPAAWCGWSSVD